MLLLPLDANIKIVQLNHPKSRNKCPTTTVREPGWSQARLPVQILLPRLNMLLIYCCLCNKMNTVKYMGCEAWLNSSFW